jgi:hypothetical protein
MSTIPSLANLFRHTGEISRNQQEACLRAVLDVVWKVVLQNIERVQRQLVNCVQLPGHLSAAGAGPATQRATGLEIFQECKGHRNACGRFKQANFCKLTLCT